MFEDRSEASYCDRGWSPSCWAPPGVEHRSPGNHSIHCDHIINTTLLKLVEHFPGHSHRHSFSSSPLQVPMPAQSKSILQVGPTTGMSSNLFQKSVRGMWQGPNPTSSNHIFTVQSCVLTFPSPLCQGILSPNLTLITGL